MVAINIKKLFRNNCQECGLDFSGLQPSIKTKICNYLLDKMIDELVSWKYLNKIS